ncbi:unnamed protein product [Rotaria sp. Silwood2]|nr:unnamed protein product [Rotaria sp. Silwood2]
MNTPHLFSHFTSLPDELMLIIFKSLDTVDAFSFININERFNNILYDAEIINHLQLFRLSENKRIDPLDDELINRFCSQILPAIHHKIEWLDLESSSIERILLATTYDNLFGIGLWNMDAMRALYLFYSKHSVLHLLKKQISSISIKINDPQRPLIENAAKNIFQYVLAMFPNLYRLSFETSIYCEYMSLDHLAQTICYSNLLQLYVTLQYFEDCLHLLDGHFNQLHTLYINLSTIHSDQVIYNEKKLYNLKCLSLTCDVITNKYDELIVPLIRRMSNLEQLSLYLQISHNRTFIDGNDLRKNIMDYLLHLKQFRCNIYSFIFIDNAIDLPSNEDVQCNLGNNQIISYVSYFPKNKMGLCNICSYSSSKTIKYYYYITNNFPGGLFKYVQQILLYDEYPFEHEFFIRISESFPIITYLSLTNPTSQKKKQSQPTNLPIVKFNHLNKLSFDDVHDDYIEQFLFDTKTYLPNKVLLGIELVQLQIVTNNFTRLETRNNCAKLGYQY